MEKELKHGEVLKVDTGCVVAYTPTLDFDIEFVRGVKNLLFGGEGFFFARLTGSGKSMDTIIADQQAGKPDCGIWNLSS